MSRFLQKGLQSLEVYTPGEQPQDKQYIKLNTNESPYPPGPKTLAAINRQEGENLRLYSDPECTALRDALAQRYGVERGNVYAANGSDDILNFAFWAFCGSGGKVRFPEISYGFYSVFADLHGCVAEPIPLKEDFSIDPGDYAGVNTFVVIANPNAPTGLALSLDAVEEIVKSNPNHVVLIDEAYVDFGGESAVPLTKKYENLLVVQTFSKSRSMAGGRLGFAIGNRGLIEDLERLKYSTNPYCLNRLTLAAGTAALLEDGYYMDNCKKIIAARAWTKAALEALDFTVLPSKTNFLFAASKKISGEELYRKLKERGILVRHFGKERIKNYNRITIGTQAQMEALVQAVREIMGG